VTVVEPDRSSGPHSGSEAGGRTLGTGPAISTGARTPVGAAFEPATMVHPDRDRWWLRRLMPLLRAHRAVLVLSMLAALVAVLVQVAIPRVVGLAIDEALEARTAALWPFAAALAALAVVRGLLTFSYRYGLNATAFHLEYSLRALLFEHLTTLSFGFYDRVQSGQIISRANSDIRSVQLYLAFAPIMATQFVSFVVAVVIMARIDLLLTAVAMVCLPGVYVFGQRLRTDTFPLSWIVQARQAEVATIVDESVNGVRVVKAFAAEEAQIGLLARAAQRLRWANLRLIASRATYNPIIENLPRLGLALVLLVGGLQAIEGRVEVGDLVSFTLYIVILTMPFRFLGLMLVLGQRARASAGRIFEILDERPDVVERPGAIDLVDPHGEVRFEGVSFAYGAGGDGTGQDHAGGDGTGQDHAAGDGTGQDHAAGDGTGQDHAGEGGAGGDGIDGATGGDRPDVLDGLDLYIPAGQCVALVGRTGSGKSTVPRLLARFYDPTAGRISIDGHDITNLTLESLRRAVGIVGDEPFIFSASVHDNIAYARAEATREEVVRAARAAHADEFIGHLQRGYDTVVGERGYDLSGGQRQRIAIARILLADPAILVLDDATSSIDVHVEAGIHEALAELTPGRTTIIVAHRLSTIALADRMLLLEGGRIVADGTHRELLAREPRYGAVLTTVLVPDASPQDDLLDEADGPNPEVGA
jgi:ATP-binding cassette, subfamily B, bacterial